MTLPKQPTNITPDRQARAPYNFVELPERAVKVEPDELPDQRRFHPGRHSGALDCTLTTESPLYTRGGVFGDEAESAAAGEGADRVRAKDLQAKDRSEFFYVWDRDEPVIPGSTLRGLMRALVEIASFGKMSEVSSRGLVYRAVGDTTSHGARYRDRVMTQQGRENVFVPKYRAGYVVKRGSDWKIQPAREINGTTYAVLRQPPDDSWFFDNLKKKLAPLPECNNAYRIYVRAGAYDYKDVKGGFLSIKKADVQEYSVHPRAGLEEATLALSGPMSSKRSEAVVFAPDPDPKVRPILIPDHLAEDYREQVSKEQAKLLGHKDGVLRSPPPKKEKDWLQPVFYTLDEDGGLEFLGHCRMLRLPYRQSPRDFVPPELRKGEIDLAEALFGFTDKGGKGKSDAYAGRVFFGDARLSSTQENIWLVSHRPLTPKILASPKPTTFQHYLVQTRPNKVTVGRDRRGDPRYEVRLSDYTAPTPDESVLRGHKLYWHKGAVGLKDIEHQGEVKETQVTKITPLRAGVKFSFQLRFDNLSEAELGALLWVLQVAADERYRLKVGMGKPLGMGAVKITSALRLFNRRRRYAGLFENGDWNDGEKASEPSRQVWQNAVAAFERRVLLLPELKGFLRLEEVGRIKQLFAMLSWPGPDPEQTRYMEIERPDPNAKRGKRNEYKERPVLPDPLVVAGIVTPRREAEPSRGRVASIADTQATSSSEQTHRGTIKFFKQGLGSAYGFITPDEPGAKDVFFTREAVTPGRRVASGQHVAYVLDEQAPPDKPRAKKIL